ncbi:MAG: DUF5615 family PIN-like protein [Chloroflexi bacterium]|nr:DUF5615 family PIN-like protein [Chloroflexota bacterium]
MASNAPCLYIALYTDEDIDGELAAQIRANGYDAISTPEVNNLTLSDEMQVAFATSQQRAILTHNAKDFEPLFREYLRIKKEHYGIIISDQIEIGELLRRVLNMLDRVDAEQMKNTFHHLGEFK